MSTPENPPKRGRGRPKGSTQANPIKISKGIAMTEAQWAALDKMRGSETRGDLIIRLLGL
ncbi:MAG: hypothetical protein QM680_14575 [Luteolibacter sp.]